MLDILQDTTEENIAVSLELDRLKAKLREVWHHALMSQYEQDKSQSNTEEPMPELEEYLAMNALKFPGDSEEMSEEDELIKMLEEMTDSDEDLDPVNTNVVRSHTKTAAVSMGCILDKDNKRLKNLVKRNNKKYGVVL
jgi:hypothetical protein